MKKKIISVLLSLIMIFSLSANVSAIGNDLPVATNTLNKILDSFRKALKNGDEYLSLTEYGLYDDESKTLYYGLYDLFVYNCNDTGSFKLGKYNESYVTLDLISSSGNITGVKIKYDDHYVDENGKFNKEQLEKDKKLVSERYRKALSVVKRNMTDVEKALALYDYLLTITDYPASIGQHGTESYPTDSYKAYGLLRDGYSTCLAYSKLYAILLNESGVKAVTVGSDTIAHEWVMVCIDGEWYHCDPTWDDFVTSYGLTTFFHPNDDEYDRGAVSHEYFLKSDEEFLEMDHIDWEVSFTANPDRILETPKSGESGKFDDKFFSYNNEKFLCFTAMWCINGNWYFADEESNSVVRTTIDGEPEYISLPDENEYIRYIFSYENDLYVSTDESVYRFDTVSDKYDKIFAVSATYPGDENKYTVFSEMSIIYDEMTLTTADYEYTNDEDADEWFSNINFSTETYPMSEIRFKEPVGDNEEKTVSASRDTLEINEKIRTIVSDEVPQPISPVDSTAVQKRSSSLIYLIIGVVVLGITAAAVIAALIIHKKR